MTDDAEKLTPEGIRAIRERLGLSQADAGELLGGGPRAFAKYEGGVIEPAASLITLLRLLDSNPKLLEGLGQRKSIPAPRGELGPFEVSGRHIAELKDRQAASLLRRLVAAEALAGKLQCKQPQQGSRFDVVTAGQALPIVRALQRASASAARASSPSRVRCLRQGASASACAGSKRK